MTTNRVRVFDEAFQSRIHVSLRYHDLTSDARRKIWVAFLRKVHGDIPNGGLSADELRDLGEKRINGRQIKNIVRTGNALALAAGRGLHPKDITTSLKAMKAFELDFSAKKREEDVARGTIKRADHPSTDDRASKKPKPS